jgi:DNA-directed RNA polymerase subunit A"
MYIGKYVIDANYSIMDIRNKLLRHTQPGEQVGVRLAHHALSEATQSSLSAFHNAGLGSGIVTKASPSLQQIMDGVINNSNTSMVIKTDGTITNAICYRPLRYYVDDITNSFADTSLDGKDFWYDIGRMYNLPKTNKYSSIFRFHLNYRKLVRDFVTLKHLVDEVFKGFSAYNSPDFMGIIDIHLESDTQISNMMEFLEKHIGISGISSYNMVDENMFITTGSNLGHILYISGVDSVETISNNIYDVEKNLGVDAAREVLYHEILAKTSNVHTAALIADFMTCKGFVAPFKKDNPVLKSRGFLSSIAFERPKSDVKGVVRNKIVDYTTSVYSQIITGQLPNVGSGSRLFSLEDCEELDWSM